MTNPLKKALSYARTDSNMQIEQNLVLTEQRDAIFAFALANGYDIVDHRNDIRPVSTTDIEWLEEYFQAHSDVKFLIIFSLERLNPNLYEAVELAKYLKKKYGVVVISLSQPDLDIPNCDLDTLRNYRLD